MSFRLHTSFYGLHPEHEPGSNVKRFSIVDDDLSGTNGFFSCPRLMPSPPHPPGTVLFGDCAKVTPPISLIHELDMMAAVFTNFVTSETQTLAERAELDPTPDYAQIFVRLDADAETGVLACAEEDGAPAGCGPEVEGTIAWTLETATGAFPFGVTETPIGQGIQTYSEQEVPTHDAGEVPDFTGTYLRRATSAYTGHPENDGTDTLFPWSEVIGDPELLIGATAITLHGASTRSPTVIVTPWYVNEGGGGDAGAVMWVT